MASIFIFALKLEIKFKGVSVFIKGAKGPKYSPNFLLCFASVITTDN